MRYVKTALVSQRQHIDRKQTTPRPLQTPSNTKAYRVGSKKNAIEFKK